MTILQMLKKDMTDFNAYDNFRLVYINLRSAVSTYLAMASMPASLGSLRATQATTCRSYSAVRFLQWAPEAATPVRKHVVAPRQATRIPPECGLVGISLAQQSPPESKLQQILQEDRQLP